MFRNTMIAIATVVMLFTSEGFPASEVGVTDAPDLSDYGFDRQVLETPVGQMTVFAAGRGKPLLLLHGVGAGASSFLWYRIAPALARHYRVIAPDFVGWGQSERLARPIGFDDYVAQIEFIGTWLDEPVDVVAQSLTSGFAIEAMNRGHLLVDRLILNAPSGGKDFGGDAFPPGATDSFLRMVDGPDSGKSFYEQAFLASGIIRNWYENTGFANPAAVPQELIDASEQGASQPNSHFSALPFLSGTLRYDVSPFLRGLDVPALMVWGEQEIQIDAETRQRLENVNPRIESARIAGARSTFEVEFPEATLGLIQGFLDRDSERL